MNLLTRIMMTQRNTAWEQNKINIFNMLEKNCEAKFIDLGCDDGKWSVYLANKIGTKDIYGIEISDKRIPDALSLGVKVKQSDLNDRFPFDDNFFDVVHSNQVIEHLQDPDNFVAEIYRILKPGGYAVISTENLASWHNVFSLILGYTPFSLANTTYRTASLGNPLAPHSNEAHSQCSSWRHVIVFTVSGIKHLFELSGFKVEKISGGGYYPLGNIFAKINVSHSAFMTLKVRKQKTNV